LKLENKRDYDIKGKIGCNGDTMSFSEIGEALDITEQQAKQIFETAMRKLRSVGINRELWEYMNIGDTLNDQTEQAGISL